MFRCWLTFFLAIWLSWGKAHAETFAEFSRDAGSPETTEPLLEREVEEALTPTSACRRLAVVRCKAILSCCQGFLLSYETEEACVYQEQLRCLGTTFEREIQALSKGLLFLNEEKLRSCEVFWEKNSQKCTEKDEDLMKTSSCRQIFTERAFLGETCRSELVGLVCAGGQGVCVTLPGQVICKGLGKAGDSCDQVPCDEENALFCKEEGGRKRCEARGETGATCSLSLQCQQDLRCVMGICSARKAKGETCGGFGDCAQGLVCDPWNKRCLSRASRAAVCSFPQQCLEGLVCAGLQAGLSKCLMPSEQDKPCGDTLDCAKGLRCVDRLCVPLPEAGEVCRAGEGCKEGFFCYEPTERCAALPSTGEACRDVAPRCKAGLGCFASQGKGICGEQRKVGESCAEDDQCAGVWVCREGVCRPLPSVGEPCHKGRCDANVSFCGSGERCHAYRTVGESCAVDAECPPQQECAEHLGRKMCVALPHLHQDCQRRCAQGLLCQPYVQPGTCAPVLCRDFLRCQGGKCHPDPETTPTEFTPPEPPPQEPPQAEKSAGDAGITDASTVESVSQQDSNPKDQQGSDGPDFFPREFRSPSAGGCACSGEGGSAEWFGWSLLFFFAFFLRRVTKKSSSL